MGLFFYTKKGSIISTVDLPTTEIIEPKYDDTREDKRPLFLFDINPLFPLQNNENYGKIYNYVCKKVEKIFIIM